MDVRVYFYANKRSNMKNPVSALKYNHKTKVVGYVVLYGILAHKRCAWNNLIQNFNTKSGISIVK